MMFKGKVWFIIFGALLGFIVGLLCFPVFFLRDHDRLIDQQVLLGEVSLLSQIQSEVNSLYGKNSEQSVSLFFDVICKHAIKYENKAKTLGESLVPYADHIEYAKHVRAEANMHSKNFGVDCNNSINRVRLD